MINKIYDVLEREINKIYIKKEERIFYLDFREQK